MCVVNGCKIKLNIFVDSEVYLNILGFTFEIKWLRSYLVYERN